MQNYTTKRNHTQCKRKRHVYLKTIADWKDMSVGLVAINVQQPLTIAAAAAGVAPTMCTHPRCQRLAATIVEKELELAATFVEEELELVAPFLPINRQQESRANWVREVWECEEYREKVESCNGSKAAAIAAAASATMRVGSRVRVKWSSSSMYLFCILSLISNTMTLSRGCRRICQTT